MSTDRGMLAKVARFLVGVGHGGGGGSTEGDVETRRRAVLTQIVCYTGALLALIFFPAAMLQGKWALGIIELGLVVVLGGVGLYIRLVGYHAVLNFIGGVSSAAAFLLLLITGGAGGSGHIWALTFPLFALFIWGARKGAMGSLLLLSCIVAYFVFDEQLAFAAHSSWAFKARFLAGYGLVLSFTYFFERTRADSQGLLAARNLDLERKVAELKVTDEARRESETVLKATLESTGDGVLVIDTKGKVMATNDEFAQMWGIPAEVMATGEDAQLVEHVLDLLVDPAAFTARIEQLYESDEEAATDTLHFKDGRVLERTSAPLILDSAVKGRVWSFRDTSERVQAEHEKARLQAELQRSQKMEALGTLAGGVAHDLNNVLAGIVGYPDLLLKTLPEDSPLREDLLTIRASGTKAALIVQDLLTLTRRGVATKSVLNLNDVVRSYLDGPEYRDLLSFHPKLVLESRLDDNLLNISASAVHLNKTVMNLVSNAAEAMPEGGEIQISTSNRYVDTPVLGYDSVEEGEYVLLVVSDSGVGIPQNDIDHIFEPFYTKKRMGRSGSGLGLAVIWGTVKDLDGYVDVRSAEGEGAVFTLYLPATREDVEIEQTPSTQMYRGNGESILVVDDMPEQRDVAERMLTDLGYSVTAVASGEEAVDHLQQREVELVVLDMIMSPGMDGLDTYKRILERHPGQRAIIASGYSETDRVTEAQKLGAGPYLKKPYLQSKLGMAVKKALAAGPED